MQQLVLVVLAALAGVVGYNEAQKFARRSGRDLWGRPAWVWGIASCLLGLVGAFFASALVVAALTGVVGYCEGERFQRNYGEAASDVPAWVWGVLCAFVGLIGALLLSTLAWGVVCCVALLLGSVILLNAEKNTLIAEKTVLMRENTRLIAEKDTKRHATAPKPADRPADPGAAAPEPQQSAPVPRPPDLLPQQPRVRPRGRLALQPQRPASSTSAGWPYSPQPSAGNVGGSDLLPRHR